MTSKFPFLSTVACKAIVALAVVVSTTSYTPAAASGQQARAGAEARAGASSPAKKTARLFMWKISKGNNNLYLLGSIHVMKPEFYPLPRDVEKTFQKCDRLILEIDESKSDPKQMQQMMTEKGLYPEGDNLRNHISKDTRRQLDKYMSTHDGTANILRMRPWLAGLMLPMIELQKTGFDPKLGIDQHFLDEAVASGKPTGECESADFQLKLISSFSDELQDRLLESSLLDAEDLQTDVAEMMRAWKTGDAEAMDEVAGKDEKEHPELKEVMEKLLYDRNIAMSDKIEEYLKSGKECFMVVGAAHLVGDRGLLQLLKKRHYKVEQMVALP